MIARKVFATEDPEALYFNYSIEIRCRDRSKAERTDAILTLRGTGTLRLHPLELTEVRPEAEALIFTNADGTQGKTSNQYV